MKNNLSPHDRFFRASMTNPHVVHEFFTAHLPNNIKQIVDFTSIQLKNDSFIDDKLKLQITDLLFSAEFKHRPGYFYLLVEHQSTPQKLMPFRMLKYMVAIMEQHLKHTKTDFLPIVYPILFYNGRTRYNYSTAIFDLFGDDKRLAQEILYQPLQLVDLTKIPDENFNSMLWYGVMARTMKHIFAKDFLPMLKDLMLCIKNIENSGNLDYIYTILSYIVEAGEITDQDKFQEIIKTNLTHIDEEQVMTLAEIWKQEGRQKGKLEGMQLGLEKGKLEGKLEGEQKGKQETLRSVIVALLQQNFTINQIAKFINLPITEVNRLKEQIH